MTLQEIRDTLLEMHTSLGNIQPVFNKNKYPGEFEAYYKKWEPFFMELEKEYEQAEDPDSFLEEIADAPAAAAYARYETMKKRKKEMIMMQEQLALVTFVYPCILYYKSSFSETLAAKMCDAWNRTFNMTLKTATFETINAGFTRKWCYITTAVCESLQKPDDCRELTMLRAYRDDYLSQSEDGREMIARYYDIAPTIVHRINRRAESASIYEAVYKDYIIPCLDAIEDGDNERCLTHYRDMVETMEERYLYS